MARYGSLTAWAPGAKLGRLSPLTGPAHRRARDAEASGAIEVDDAARTAHLLLDLVEGALTRARITDDLAPIADLEQALLMVVGAPKVHKVRASSARKSH